MRVIEQLIDLLRLTGHLTADQLDQLREMGLLKDKRDDYADYLDPFDSQPEIPRSIIESARSRTDELDAIGDRLLDAVRRAATGRRGRGRRAAAQDSDMIAAVKRSIAQEQGFVDLVTQIARRMNPGVDDADAPRLVGSADPAHLDAVLARDSLWTGIWPHIDHEPIISGLEGRARRRFCRLIAVEDGPNKSIPRRLTADRVLRRAVDVVDAHRELCGAFGRVALSLDPWRVFADLFTGPDQYASNQAYTVLVILFSARNPRRSIGEIPCLPTDVGLPAKRGVPSTSNWATAARIDPLAVLPFMEWWEQPWATVPKDYVATCQRLRLDGVHYFVPQSDAEWFGVTVVDQWKWVSRVRFTPHVDAQPGQLSGSINVDGVEYVHVCTDSDCRPPKWFSRRNPDGRILLSEHSAVTVRYQQLRYDHYYDMTWAVGLLDKPLLTCPKEWEQR